MYKKPCVVYGDWISVSEMETTYAVNVVNISQMNVLEIIVSKPQVSHSFWVQKDPKKSLELIKSLTERGIIQIG